MTNSVSHAMANSSARRPVALKPIGQLPAETCHELGNLLGAVVLNLERVKACALPAKADHLENALNAANLAKTLIQTTMREALSDASAPTDLAEMVTSLTPLLKSMLGPNIDLRVKTCPQTAFASVDK